ncbi:hypothetical protein LTR84_009789 [Exophiala bonariae]|uniref:Uncharacterized protein n=1 Tax=Exophiala bonariae TaxID=1690606 RepID=A0AAV9NNH8_9EURO|nr:hypothetical protein LTR84_009789 [Exophiala bonariae]
MKSLFYLSSLALAAAGDISLQAFTDSSCGGDGGTAIQNVHADGSDVHDSSGCRAQGQYNSVNVVSVDPGFRCNVYGDSACQNFLETVLTVSCTPVIGQGVICFNQAAFDNPFVESTSAVAIGSTTVNVVGGDSLQNQLNNAVNQACTSGTACDPTHTLVLHQTFDPPAGKEFCSNGGQLIDKSGCTSEDCSTTISISGSFNDNNQRDYMKGLLQSAAGSIPSPVTFLQVQVLSKTKAIQAQMSVTVSTQCTAVAPPSGFTCSSALKDIVSAALATVPGVGGISSLAFQADCDING